jgi:hypothetical protein
VWEVWRGVEVEGISKLRKKDQNDHVDLVPGVHGCGS